MDNNLTKKELYTLMELLERFSNENLIDIKYIHNEISHILDKIEGI